MLDFDENGTGTEDTMSVSPLVAAGRICELGNWQFTNLQLQKMLYFAQMLSLGRSSGAERLIDGQFQAWEYGPVQPEVYRTVRSFGALPIKNVFRRYRRPIAPSDESLVRETVEALRGLSGGSLVAITHWEYGAWAKNFQPGQRGILIPDEDIFDEYRRRTTQPAIQLKFRRRHSATNAVKNEQDSAHGPGVFA